VTTGPAPAARPRPQYPVESVDNALRLLLMVRDRGEIRLSEAREALGVAQSTTHRLMAMLACHDFVRQDPASRHHYPDGAARGTGAHPQDRRGTFLARRG
jgi:DNA-binding IclR family transcriptional regulator